MKQILTLITFLLAFAALSFGHPPELLPEPIECNVVESQVVDYSLMEAISAKCDLVRFSDIPFPPYLSENSDKVKEETKTKMIQFKEVRIRGVDQDTDRFDELFPEATR